MSPRRRWCWTGIGGPYGAGGYPKSAGRVSDNLVDLAALMAPRGCNLWTPERDSGFGPGARLAVHKFWMAAGCQIRRKMRIRPLQLKLVDCAHAMEVPLAGGQGPDSHWMLVGVSGSISVAAIVVLGVVALFVFFGFQRRGVIGRP